MIASVSYWLFKVFDIFALILVLLTYVDILSFGISFKKSVLHEMNLRMLSDKGEKLPFEVSIIL